MEEIYMSVTSKPVFLCGFMGCGKSTIGKILAEKLECEFTDMDNYIVEKQHMSIPQMFAEKGEDYFRKAETEAVKELSGRSGVIACGGGAMLKKINADIANKSGYVIYIEVDFDTCYNRISGDKNRPIVANNTKEELSLIYEGRVNIYKENSALTVEGSGTPEEIAKRIISFLKLL
jgi:shikimate kinase